MRSALFASLALAIAHTSAHPAQPQNSKPSLFKRTVNLESFRLKVTADYVNTTAVESEPSVKLFRRATTEDTATELVKKTVPGATFRLVEGYAATNGISHFYFKQTANGLDIDNADFNVNIARDGSVFSFGNTFFDGSIPSLQRRDTVDPVDALKGAVGALQLPVDTSRATAEAEEAHETYTFKSTSGTVSEPKARLVYLIAADGKLALTWRVETDIVDNWLLTYYSANGGEEVHGVVDYVADATYQVYPWGLNDPTEGSRAILTDPYDKKASEFSWQGTGTTEYNTTRGNNGIAQENHANIPAGDSRYLTNPRPYKADEKFEYPYSLTDTDWKGYANASITQLFYTANTYHDLLYLLGFTERAGNFELNNNAQGGVGNDFVILNSQDGAGLNNANFGTPPDGSNGRMRMYMWNATTPWRDGSFEAGIVIHEYTHGLSNRLTGGPANTACLSLLEAGGMGEGWGDWYATAIRLKPTDTRNTSYPMGVWASGKPGGIRLYPYSTSLTINPHTYKDVDTITGVHPIGTVWATMLYEVLWNLIDKHGKNDAAKPSFDANGVPTDGKYLAMKLVLDGMALQPCNPNFVTARNAILDADVNLTGGANKCAIWTGFAKRGLGEGAKYNASKRTASTAIPAGVC